MTEQIVHLLTQYGAKSGIIGVLISLVIIMIRNQPITFLTSTRVERILYTKEKRVSLEALKLMFLIIIMSIIFFTAVFYSINLHFKYYKVIGIIGGSLLFIGFIAYCFILIKYNGFDKFIRVRSTNYKIILSFIMLFYIFLVIVLPAFQLGSSISRTYIETDNPDFLSLMVALFVVSVIFSLFLTAIVKLIMNHILSIGINIAGIYLFILDKDTGQKLFLYHATDKEHFLTGDNPNYEDSTVYKMIERSELKKQKIYVYKKVKRDLK